MGDEKETGQTPSGSARTFLIRALILALAMTAGRLFMAWGAEPLPLNTLHAIHSLTKADARAGLPVAFEATVTYYNRSDVDLFVQEGNEAIYVETKPNEDLALGDRVLIKGKARDSFTPDVLSDQVTLLHHGSPPNPVEADFERLIRAQLDCLRVAVRAKVRSADAMNFGNMQGIYLKLLMDGGSIDATVVGTDASRVRELLDADVELTGVVSGKFDSKMQLVGILLEVSSLGDVKVLARAKTSPEFLPITPMNEVLSSSHVQDLTRRVRVQGTITYYQPGSGAVLQIGDESLWISTHTSAPMRIGDLAIATGFPDAREGFLELSDAEVQDSNFYEPIAAQPATWRQLATWNSGDPDGHQSDLVSFEGQVMTAVREDSQDEFVLSSDGKLFTAIFRHPPSNRPLPSMKQIPVGTRIRVTGICMAAQANSIAPAEQEVPFNILLRSFDDIEIVAKPSLLNVRNLMVLVGLLLALLLAGGARAWVLERKVRYQNAEAAYTERRRSRILEDINGSRPLAEIIEQITELVSFKLHGVPCWCQIFDGAKLGNSPLDPSSFRIVHEQIPAHTGPPLGIIYAAFAPLAIPRANESETLLMAAGLASLAIETRRLYSDLVHRSEFDLLTDIHNRFSLERFLNKQIDLARQNAGIFGLVYIDLNDFKRVNDVYGHQAGDLYLQEVAIRMKHHLRSEDVLARLGGDEFAVLLTKVHNRAEVEEVAFRLERCLDTPFVAEGYVVQGSASVGFALYPEDGSTKDSLLSAADAAMYSNKHVRREIRGVSVEDHPGPTPEDRA
ncbi:MAG TPA: GGDEF domain-containing protein [Terracidiphilus sp.]|jgi:diguanylate cyclase (GGDEF)-like protein|nr:GGDEF domain-containing protein [Terracidiphilus sp.]